MEKERICALCGESLSEDDEGHILEDGRVVCDDCFDYSCAECGFCGKIVPEDELEFFGDDVRICPDCFAEEFPDVDEDKNLEETTEAYEAMKKRLIGLKVEDMEAVRAGFDECWKQRDFKTIVSVGERLPETVLQEDPALLMYYDNACSRV